MKIYVEASIILLDEFNDKLVEEEQKLRKKLESYIVGNGGSIIGDTYRVDYMSPEYKEIMKFGEYNDYPCDTCGCRILKDVNNLKVGKKVKGGRPRKMFKFGAEIEELLCVSVDLYNYFIDNGVNSEDFSPVYCGKNIQGYAFTPKEEYDIKSSVYEHRKCKSCGRDYAIYDIPKGYHVERFELHDPIDFSAHDVYKTKEYFDREQRILISPKLFNLMEN